jgi:hypothetical protein
LLEHADFAPVAVTGNYLVLRWRHASEEYSAWLANLVESRDERVIALPTGGVFAEGVLGRSNTAEKLDVSRFWNWQDSPIPIQAPDIAAVGTAQRRGEAAPLPGGLDQPVLNIVNAPSLPEPTGIGAALTAVTQPNIFRDMTGLESTIDLARAALAASSQGASAALSDVVGLAGLASGLGAGRVSGLTSPARDPVRAGLERALSPMSATVSGTGALLNHARQLDKRVPTSGTPASAIRSGTGRGETTAEEAAFRSLLPTAELRAATGRGGDGSGDQVVQARGDLRVAKNWADLIRFRPAADLLTAWEARGLRLLPLSDAYGDLNLDYYPVKITKLPIVNGVQVDAAGLFHHVRTRLNEFIDTDNSRFDPYEQADDALWQSDNPLGSITNIKVNTMDLVGIPSFESPWLLPDFIDQALVGCSATTPALTWTFSTLGTTLSGALLGPALHPVSGNRMFGLVQRDDHWVFFTRGADRTTSHLDWAGNVVDLVWSGADSLWQSLQRGVAGFVRQHQGQAEVEDHHSDRYPWLQVRRLLSLGQPHGLET